MQKVANFLRSKYGIFLAGTIFFGLSYFWIKDAFEPVVFTAIAIGYVIALRLLAEKFGKDS